MGNPFAFVTLLTSDHYLPGALNLVAALRHVHQSPILHPDVDNFDIVCIVTPETVDVKSIKLLRRAFDQVVGVEVIEQRSFEGLRLLGRLDLAQVLTKLHVFRLTDYSKIVFLDADVLPLRPLSHLFNLPYEFAAAPDVGWPDIFNSGVMLLTPAQSNFDQLLSLVQSRGTWDGGDQGLINEWRGDDWHRLSFTYNTTPTAAYTYAPAYSRFGSDIKAVHFIGPSKPWSSLPYRAPFSSSKLQDLLDSDPKTYGYSDLVDKWYSIYDKNYRLQPLVKGSEYEVKKYESAWDASSSTGAQSSVPYVPLGLEELRRAAVEGSSAIPQPTQVHAPTTEYVRENQPSEGQYRTLPLEGRLDLIPRRAPSPRQEKDDDSITPRAAPQTLTTVPSMIDLPSPVQSLPPPSVQSIAAPTPQAVSPQLLPSLLSRQDYLPPQQGNDESRADEPGPSHVVETSSPEVKQQQHFSPPLIAWNPAVEPPPSNPPPQSAFVPDSQFENVWDQSATKTGEREDSRDFFVAPQTRVPENLIQEGHYTNVMHSTAIRPTHQRQPSQLALDITTPPVLPPVFYDPHKPDKEKVTSVFPWESTPRHVPGRIFPRTASPPPAGSAQYIQPDKAPPVTSPTQTSVTQTFTSPSKETGGSPSLSSSSSFPNASTFQNAWDIVPSIQRYATRLQRPASTSPPQPQNLPPKGRRSRRGSAATFKSWEELGDSSSHEADVEDEGDEASDDGYKDNLSRTGRGDVTGRRVSGSSFSQDERTGKTYRSQGAQTVKPSRRDKGVQHNHVETSTTSSTSASTSSKGSSTASTRRTVPLHMSIQTPAGSKMQPEMGTPSVDEPQGLILSTAGKRAVTAAGLRDPTRIQRQAFSPQTPPARKTSSPPKPSVMNSIAPVPAPVLQPRSSDDTVSSSQGSTISQGPVSPKDGQPVTSPIATSPVSTIASAIPKRPAGRAWNPARGVDVFKSQSEEVLARFLKMGSWDEKSAAA